MASLGRGVATAAWAGAVSAVATLLAGCPIEIEADLGREPPAREASAPVPDAWTDAPPPEAAGGDAGVSYDAALAPLAPLLACAVTASDSNDGGNSMSCPKSLIPNEPDSIFTDAGIVTSTVGRLPGEIVAGQTYQYIYDRSNVVSVSISNPVTVDVYGANAPDVCAPRQKFFTLVLDTSTKSEGFCFTATENYEYALNVITNQSTVFYASQVVGTLCPGCDPDQ